LDVLHAWADDTRLYLETLFTKLLERV
jgi:two-component SAPR family response regulator